MLKMQRKIQILFMRMVMKLPQVCLIRPLMVLQKKMLFLKVQCYCKSRKSKRKVIQIQVILTLTVIESKNELIYLSLI